MLGLLGFRGPCPVQQCLQRLLTAVHCCIYLSLFIAVQYWCSSENRNVLMETNTNCLGQASGCLPAA